MSTFSVLLMQIIHQMINNSIHSSMVFLKKLSSPHFRCSLLMTSSASTKFILVTSVVLHISDINLNFQGTIHAVFDDS